MKDRQLPGSPAPGNEIAEPGGRQGPHSRAEPEALAGALPAWDLLPEAPFVRRR